MNPEAALNRRGSALHHQTLVLTAIIYKMLTIVVVNLLKPTMRRGEQVSIANPFPSLACSTLVDANK